MSKLQNVALYCYIAVAVITFGHAWKVMSIFAPWAASCWPLYWSVQFWSNQ